MVGITVALILAAEFGYRLLLELPFDIAGNVKAYAAKAPSHPYDSEGWYPAWDRVMRSFFFGGEVDYDPYRGWWPRPISYDGLHVDDFGLRTTVQFGLDRSTSTRTVFLLGGSAMWGYTARDHATIPSLVAKQLAAHGVHNIEVVNLSQIAFNLSQSLATLTLRLRGGDQPIAAVFLDGVNQIGPINAGEQPGEIWRQREAQERFERGRRGRVFSALRDIPSRLRIVEGLLRLRNTSQELPPANIEDSCETVAIHYRNLVRVGEALGNEFNVETMFFWQPTLAMSRKHLGPWETWLMGAGLAKSEERLVEMLRECSSRVHQHMRGWEGSRFFSLHHIHDDQRSDVFLDHYGHVTESANGVIAAEITSRLLPLVRSQNEETNVPSKTIPILTSGPPGRPKVPSMSELQELREVLRARP